MAGLVLRVEADGEVLGEFVLDDDALVMHLQDRDTGRVVTTLTLAPGLAAPAFTPLPPLPEPAPDGNLFQDKTVDLALQAEPTLAKGLERIRATARKAAPSVINFEIPAEQPPVPAPSSRVDATVPEPPVEEAQVLEQPAEPATLAPREHEPQPVPPDDHPRPVAPHSPDEPELPGEDARAHQDAEGTDCLPKTESGDARGQAGRPGAQGGALPEPGQDRSITRTLSNGMVDLIQSLEAEARSQADGFGEATTGRRPTITESLLDDDASQPTRIERGGIDDPGLADAGRPTRVSKGDHPSGDAERPRPIVGTDFADEEDEPVTVVARSPDDDFTLGLPVDPRRKPTVSGYDEVPGPDTSRRQASDDLSLSLPYDPAYHDASMDDLSLALPSEATVGGSAESSLSLSLPLADADSFEAADDDDLTLPLPEEDSDSAAFDDLGSEATVTHEHRKLEIRSLGRPQVVTPRLMDTTGGFERDPSTERLEGAEVWFRRHGEWTPRGALGLGQHVQAFGGMVRCDDSGGLVVLAGPRLHGSATLPSGELRQIQSGQQAVHLPAGTSVIMWQGEQGIYVRSNVAAEASGPVLDQGPVVYRRPPRSRAWKPPASDLEET